MNKYLSKAVLTIATGKPLYIWMAVSLARSFKWWHKNSSIKFTIATDQKNLIPPDLSDIQIIDLQPGQYGLGFSPKLYLDKISPANKTLFIDADCLCAGSLDSVFECFDGHPVSVVGGIISWGEWFGDVAEVCRRFGLTALPKFNGGLYYLEKGEISDCVYATARELEAQYDKIGLVRLRNRPNDELLMAIAMALHNQKAIHDDGSILSDPQACPGAVFIDSLRGNSRLVNPPMPHPKHQPWYPFTEVHPVLIHFLGNHTKSYPYTREKLRLTLVLARKWPIWAADVLAFFYITIPQLTTRAVKNMFRPVYRRLFGIRAVSVSEHI